MREDQYLKLQQLAETLADVFITEADPANWTAHGVLPRDMTKDQRGNRHWDRKGAVGTGAVLRFTLDALRARDQAQPPQGGGTGDGNEGGSDLDSTIAEAERRAAAALDRVLNKARGKDEFDRRAIGTKPAR